jgi:hypothetical protein
LAPLFAVSLSLSLSLEEVYVGVAFGGNRRKRQGEGRRRALNLDGKPHPLSVARNLFTGTKSYSLKCIKSFVPRIEIQETCNNEKALQLILIAAKWIL